MINPITGAGPTLQRFAQALTLAGALGGCMSSSHFDHAGLPSISAGPDGRTTTPLGANGCYSVAQMGTSSAAVDGNFSAGVALSCRPNEILIRSGCSSRVSDSLADGAETRYFVRHSGDEGLCDPAILSFNHSVTAIDQCPVGGYYCFDNVPETTRPFDPRAAARDYRRVLRLEVQGYAVCCPR